MPDGATEGDCWAVVFVGYDRRYSLLGSTATLAAGRDVAAAWWLLRSEAGDEIHPSAYVVVTPIEGSVFCPVLWRARLDAGGWHGEGQESTKPSSARASFRPR